MALNQLNGANAMGRVTIVVAVGKLGSDFSKVGHPDRLATPYAVGLPTWRPAIHQNVSHVAPPNAKQNTVSDELNPTGGGAHR